MLFVKNNHCNFIEFKSFICQDFVKFAVRKLREETVMIKITLPDGSVREYPKGTTALDIAKSISEGLARKVLAAKVNGQVWDATRPIYDDAAFKLLMWDDTDGKSTFWHSSAHLMAEAVESMFPGVKFWVGPPVDRGFYYDMDLGDRKLNEEDLLKLEKKMNELAKQNNSYIRKEVPKAEAVKYFSDKGDEYKLDLLSNLNDGEITFYTQGNFTDLCRGPHIPNTGFIKAIKLTNIAGAYWKGDEKNKQLTRVYGVTFPSQKELDEYMQLLEEAKRRDHRKLGKELSIFTMDDDVGPGLPLWLPNGTIIIEELEKRNIDPEVIHCIASHGPKHFGVEPENNMDKMIYAFDELSGFIHAAALIRPTRYEGMDAKSVLKKLKTASFAAQVDREDINDAVSRINIPLETLIEFVIRHQQNVQ